MPHYLVCGLTHKTVKRIDNYNKTCDSKCTIESKPESERA